MALIKGGRLVSNNDDLFIDPSSSFITRTASMMGSVPTMAASRPRGFRLSIKRCGKSGIEPVRTMTSSADMKTTGLRAVPAKTGSSAMTGGS